MSVRLILVASGIAHLSAREHHLAVIVGYFSLLLGNSFLPERFLTRKSWLLAINAATLGYLFFGAGQMLVMGHPPLELASSFLVVLLTNKLVGPRTARDQQQLILLSLLQIVITTALSTGLLVGVLLLFYTLILPWALTEISTLRTLEAYDGKWTSHRLNEAPGTKRKLTIILASAGTAIVLGTILFFIIVPRIGFGLFTASPRENSMTGFSSRVHLGDFGRIQTNQTPVMRVRFRNANSKPNKRPYWRGISLDHYENGNWSKSFSQRQELPVPKRGFHQLAKPLANQIEQEIFLEPFDDKVIFGLPEVSAISRCSELGESTTKTIFHQDEVGDLYYSTQHPQTVRYCLRSQSQPNQNNTLKQSFSDYEKHRSFFSTEFKGAYLQVPEDSLETLDEVLSKIDSDGPTIFHRTSAIEKYLEDNYRYTLDRKQADAENPIRDFLIENPEGHCEFFASAMVLLLRRTGIAARLVNGFAGGRLNPIGDYFLVSQSNAHSWVEIFVPEEYCSADNECTLTPRWFSFDPTPSADNAADSRPFIQDLMDAVRQRWAEYIVRYSLRTQVQWFTALFNWIRMPEGTEALSSSGLKERIAKDDKSEPSTHATNFPWGTLWGFALTLMIIGLLWRRRKKRNARSKRDALAILYERFLAHYQTKGFIHEPHMTAMEFLESVCETTSTEQVHAKRFVEVYRAMRFAGKKGDLQELEMLLLLIEEAEKGKS